MMGTLELNELEVPEDLINEITDVQRERCVKILLKLQREKNFNESIQSFFTENENENDNNSINKEGGAKQK